ncbi:MAG: DUF1801 domain-containing protein [Niastella sp.]|nr:DUF1801 domain-containing protein [Niastella sp.]
MAKATKKSKAAVKKVAVPAKKAAPVKRAASAKKSTPAKKASTPAKKPTAPTVGEYIAQLEGPLARTIEAVRQVFLKTDKTVGEQIKWNAPAFYYTGDMKPFDPKEYKRDIAVVNIYKKEYVLLIFPTGARIKDGSGILEGTYTDGRRMVKIAGVDDLKSKEKALQQVIRDWLKGVG